MDDSAKPHEELAYGLAHDYLENEVGAYDLALDYIENEVGAHDFLGNWKRVRAEEWVSSALENWLKRTGEDPMLAPELYNQIEAIFSKGLTWKM